MEKLPCLPYLINRDEDRDTPALKGTLCCSCGCETFRLHHTGKQAHPLLGSWFCSWILAGEETLLIEACCSACGARVLLHCDDRSEDAWRMPAQKPTTEFIHPKLHDQRLHIEVAYGWERFGSEEEWNPAYSDFCLDAWNDGHPKKIRIFE